MILPTLSTRAVALIAGLVAMGVLALVIPSCLQKQRSERAQARVEASQAAAASESAKDAIGTQGAANDRATASEATTRSNERTIRDAQGSTDAVNPAVRDAGFASLCARKSFRDSPSGKLRCDPAAVVEGRR